jgi:DHA2 family multidrug resistance protein
MATYGVASMFGPLIGPTLGGWLTDAFSWRWCFLINLPVGILSGLGLIIFMRKRRYRAPENFDMFGFAAVSVFLASLQLMLDRGQQLDLVQLHRNPDRGGGDGPGAVDDAGAHLYRAQRLHPP